MSSTRPGTKPTRNTLSFSPKQSAERIGCSYWRALYMIRTGELPSIVIGKRRRVPRAAIEALLASAGSPRQPQRVRRIPDQIPDGKMAAAGPDN